MKLFAGLVASAAAGSSVTCNNVSTGAVEMKMMVDVADVADAAGPGADWTRSAGQWEKIYTPTAADTTEVTGNLQVTKVVDSNGCDKKTVDGVEVCISKGHQLTFTCNYPLADQTISTDSDFTVSGSDTIDSAVNYGSLNYALSVDAGATFAIGNAVTATITPVSSGLVTATILSCEVTNSDLAIDNQVSVIKTQAVSQGVACTTGCAAGWTLFTLNGDSSCLKKYGRHAINTAAATCASASAHLPLPVNQQHDADMRAALTALGFGLTDNVALDGDDIDVEGQWQRADGTTIDYLNWKAGEPNDFNGGEDFMGTAWYSGWADFSPTHVVNVVCQQDICQQKPTCDLGVTITTGQGDSTLGFAFDSFKWSTSKVGGNDVAENQSLTCAIALAKTPTTVTSQKCT